MIETAHISLALAIVSALCGVIGGIALGAWWASAKSSTIAQHDTAIAEIKSRCDRHKSEILSELEKSICAGVKAAIKDLELEYKTSLAGTSQEVAVLRQRVDEHDADIKDIFSRINAR